MSEDEEILQYNVKTLLVAQVLTLADNPSQGDFPLVVNFLNAVVVLSQ